MFPFRQIKSFIKNKSLISLGIYFVFLIFLALAGYVFFLLSEPGEATDTIVATLPKDTVLYSHFYLDKENKKEQEVISQVLATLAGSDQFGNLELQEEIFPSLSRELAIALIPTDNGNYKPLLIARLNKTAEIKNASQKYLFRNNLLYLADDEVLKKLETKDRFDLNNYFTLSSGHFNQTFFDLSWLEENIAKTKKISPSLALLKKFLAKNELKKVLVRATSQGEKISLNFITSPSLLIEANATTVAPVVQNLAPEDLIYFRGSPDETTAELEKKIISESSPSGAGKLLAASLETLPEEMLLTNEEGEINYFFTFPQISDQARIDKLKNNLTNLFVASFPQEKIKILPDQSKVIEIFGEKEKYNFAQFSLNNQESTLSYLATDKNQEDIVLGNYQNKFILSNSLKLTASVLSRAGERAENVSDLTKSCQIRDKVGQFIAFNPSILTADTPELAPFLSLFKLIFIEFEENYLAGCFL